ncbi:putative polysaccharide biosynthesis protein [Melghirimyces algeriensis]|nr:polysaccharide biosynthesis protein [Melghirimyces algeriensis]
MSGKSKRLIKGTIILSMATLITKALGLIFWLPFQNIAGDQAMGVYRQSFPFYSILLMVATAGVPITVSKFVAERVSVGDHYGAKRVMRAASVILSLTGLCAFCVLFFGSGFISEVILDSPRTESSLKVLSFALLVVPIMGVTRGYFQGHQEMIPTASSQVVEQILRVLTMVIITYWMVEEAFSTEMVSAGATLGAVTGATAGLLVMGIFIMKDRRKPSVPSHSHQEVVNQEPFFSLSKKILKFAIPISMGTLILPLIQLMDSATVPRLLRWGLEVSTVEAEKLFGIYGRGEPFVNLIATFSSALTLALIPAISAHIAKKEYDAVERKVSQAWLMTVVIGMPCAVGLAILAEPITIMMYHNESQLAVETSSAVLATLAVSTIFSTLAVTSSGILQGLGYNRLPVRHLGIGAAVKVSGNFIFVPFLGITGSAISMVLAYTIVCFLNVRSVVRNTGVKVPYRRLILNPIFCSGIMSAGLLTFLYGANQWLDPGMDRLLNTLLATGLILPGAIIYIIALLLSKTIGRAEILLLPRGEQICHWLTRLKLIQPEENSIPS